MVKNLKWLFLVSVTFMACNSDDAVTVSDSSDGQPLTSGQANFSKYVALGDSFAAGFSDNALFKAGQTNAYPNILAQQFALVGGGTFTTPFMTDNIGGFSSGGVQVPSLGVRLYLDVATSTPVPVSGVSGTDISARLTGAFNNMGIPGAKATHLALAGYASANPYFGRIASSPSATVLGDALAQNPTFFSLWIGGNDVLGYATSGGDGSNPITDPATFDAVYKNLATELSKNGRKGVVANLPDISTLPHFTTVPYNPLTVSLLGNGSTAVGTATINALNAQLYGPLKSALNYLGVTDRIDLLSLTAANPLLIKDETLTNLSTQLTAVLTPSVGAQTAAFYGTVFGQARQAKAADLVLLSTRAAIGTAPTAANSGIGMAPPAPLDKFGITYPLQDKYVLIPSEITEIKNATAAYNLTIKAAQEANGLALVDADGLMKQLSTANGISVNGYTLTSAFVFGGVFSLDGVHPSARGYAFIANKFIESINAKYGSNLKGVDVGNYQTLYPKVIN
ncbi:SGNH/GDSL hydrolase family protein [Flavobacterium tructae]|uniref:G-D-S-L family lipolytic protein n=1 Tax=Flavobacterium tructae TaxID=1114873 RepID=A0A1S1JB58_9FLAO|nr:SGNH/GDSL hydrolase family protein [Flavobacterium tructae]OHT46675.1 G-D-S-L family lipolytic protein [Flavobacterium tructae]OXB20985.1 G-D-S-L family lipolytic protein [Flavobacterium tructae]